MPSVNDPELAGRTAKLWPAQAQRTGLTSARFATDVPPAGQAGAGCGPGARLGHAGHKVAHDHVLRRVGVPESPLRPGHVAHGVLHLHGNLKQLLACCHDKRERVSIGHRVLGRSAAASAPPSSAERARVTGRARVRAVSFIIDLGWSCTRRMSVCAAAAAKSSGSRRLSVSAVRAKLSEGGTRTAFDRRVAEELPCRSAAETHGSANPPPASYGFANPARSMTKAYSRANSGNAPKRPDAPAWPASRLMAKSSGLRSVFLARSRATYLAGS